jgi:hypothetical protein
MAGEHNGLGFDVSVLVPVVTGGIEAALRYRAEQKAKKRAEKARKAAAAAAAAQAAQEAALIEAMYAGQSGPVLASEDSSLWVGGGVAVAAVVILLVVMLARR